jgi:hypothetical protein
MWNWTTRSERRRAAPALRLESLEAREVPAILIQLDYTYDATGFFRNNPAAQAVMQRVATELGNSISANLAAIAPSGANTWTASFFNPATGAQVNLPNVVVGADTIKVFVGARALGTNEAGVGGFGGYGISGTQPWINTVEARGWGGFAPWGGSIAFDTTKNWYFGQAAGVPANGLDFYSVATHEMGHVLGIGTAPQWSSHTANGYFYGANAVGVYGGGVPLSADGAHWANGLTVNGQRASLDPVLNYGVRVNWSPLDAAALRDVGWVGVAPPVAPPPVAPPVAPPPVAPPVVPPAPEPVPPVVTPVPLARTQPIAFTGSTDGVATVYTVSGGTLVPTGARFVPFPGYHGTIRVASGDFDGDGVQDYAFTVGAGPQSVVEIINGRTGGVMMNQTAVFPGFTGGLFIAAGDIDGDGKAELAVSADAGAGPQIQTFRVVNGTLQLESSFWAFDNPLYRGGSRVAVGDLNRDGFADLVVTTNGLAEGRVAMYSGADLRNGAATRLYGDFAPFPGYFGAINAAVGDMDGDGYGELVISLDRGGPAHVKIWSGASIAGGAYIGYIPPVASFYAFPPTDPSGARVAVRDMDGDGRAELVVASGNPFNSMARVMTFGQAVAAGGGAPVAYPLGTIFSFNGLYAGEHTAPADDALHTAHRSPWVDPDSEPLFSSIPVA